jgi:DNA-damage-inducible protein J
MTNISSDIINVRVEADLKNDVTKILDNLGITLSQAVKMFLTQIRLKRSIPLDLDLEKIPVMSKKEIVELGKSYQDLAKGNYFALDLDSPASIKKLLMRKEIIK